MNIMVNDFSIMFSVLSGSSVAIFFSLKKGICGYILMAKIINHLKCARIYFERVYDYIKGTNENCSG